MRVELFTVARIKFIAYFHTLTRNINHCMCLHYSTSCIKNSILQCCPYLYTILGLFFQRCRRFQLGVLLLILDSAKCHYRCKLDLIPGKSCNERISTFVIAIDNVSHSFVIVFKDLLCKFLRFIIHLLNFIYEDYDQWKSVLIEHL